MTEFEPEQIEEILQLWNKKVVVSRQSPLNYKDLRKRLDLPEDLNGPTQKSLLELADAIIVLAPTRDDYLLVSSSYIFLVANHSPWALKR